MATAMQIPTAPNLIIDHVNWKDFRRWLRLLDGRPSLRVSYDRGTLEIMTFTFGHENIGRFLDRLVSVLTEELGLPIAGGGSTTFLRRRKRKGLDPDQCYWIANEPAVRGKLRIDLRTDPPPDLAVEVDVTHSSIDRMSIYAALGVPEVWRWEESNLAFHVLQTNAKYGIAPTSLAFAGLVATDVACFVAMRGQQEENSVIRQFRAWLQTQQGGAGPTP